MYPPQARRGITLIETLLVVAVLAITLGTALPSFAAFIERLRLEGAATRLATDLRSMRVQAVARNQTVRISFQPSAAGTCYVLHTGAASACPCPGAGGASCSGDAREIKTVWLPIDEGITLEAGVASTATDPLHGTSSPANTLQVVDRRGRSIRHVVNQRGRVRSCSPDAAVPGYSAC